MPLAIRHRDDPTPLLAPIDGLVVGRETDPARMAAIQGRAEEEMRRRFAEGHRAYVARRDGVAAAWGWVATSSATIGEVGSTFPIRAGERYLWNFVTARAHRGLGIYPRLLDAIVRAESREAERFWIAWAPENHASGSGIAKAGFAPVAELSFDASGRPALRDIASGGASLAAEVLGIRSAQDELARCWRCARAAAAGTPMDCSAGRCSCDYQRPESACAA